MCFSEIGIRHMAAYTGEPRHCVWHRDGDVRGGRHLMEHPLWIRNVQLMVYLSDVNETTHCFSISPESVGQPVLEREAQLEHRGIHNLYGQAGTAILFNFSVCPFKSRWVGSAIGIYDFKHLYLSLFI